MGDRSKFWIVFATIFACYQSAEGIGIRVLHNGAMQAALMLATLPLALALGWLAFRAPLRAYALEGQRNSLRLLSTAFVAALLAKALALLAGSHAGIYVLGTRELAGGVAPVLASVLPMLLVSTFVPSIAEDLLTRGLWYRKGPVRTGAAFVAVSTLVYVLNHIYRLGNGPLEWLMLASFGIAYATALQVSGSLWAAVGLHWGWNAANGLADILWNVDVTDRTGAVLLSISAHVMLTLGCLLARRVAAAPRTHAAPLG